MKKFTFILDYRGGTYVQQISAMDLSSALQNWAAVIDSFHIPGIGNIEKGLLLEEAKFEIPTRIAGMENVWCASFEIRRSTLLVNIIATV